MTHKTRTGRLVAAGLLLAQMSAPGAPSNLGIPTLSGTRTPEQSPATTMPAPSSPGTGLSPPPASAAPSSAAPSAGPAYSFGAAPPPITSPDK